MTHAMIDVIARAAPSAEDTQEAVGRLISERFAERLWARDAELFGTQSDRTAVVANRLGWRAGPAWLRDHLVELTDFAREIREAGFRHVVLLGMGGSSLCPEVLSLVFGLPDHLKSFDILDSTDPAAVARIEAAVDLPHTLFIVASKSGSTIETRSQAAYFQARVSDAVDRPGQNFVAITDPGSALAALAEASSFRRVFLNPSDIGGRYSALSYFGMVPGALLGIPLARVCEETERLADGLRPDTPDNPGLALGALLGAASLAGQDKLTFLADSTLAPVVPWIEQLVAESTGKEGKGVVPIDAEPVGAADQYGDDRLLCRLHLAGADVAGPASAVDIAVPSAAHIGALFLLWEVATSAASRVLDINPFDEPNVSESKANTNKFLESYVAEGKFKEIGRRVQGTAIDMTTETLAGDDVASVCSSFVNGFASGDYLALLYFGDRSGEVETWLQDLRRTARDAFKIATIRGYGPRYLHSIGQLYKGGKQNGHFVMFTSDAVEDRAIPGEAYSFGPLLRAQALGDFRALTQRGRPVMHIHLKSGPTAARASFLDTWKQAMQLTTS